MGPFRIDEQARLRGQRLHFLFEPAAAAEPVELFKERVAQRRQVAHVVHRVGQLRGAQGAARPVGAGMGFIDLDAHQAPHELAVADLGGQDGQGCGHLRVEQGCNGAEQRPQDLEVLAGGVQDLHRPGAGQGRPKRFEIDIAQRVDAFAAGRRCQLQQAQLRAIGPLPHEFRVHPDDGRRCELGGQFREARAVVHRVCDGYGGVHRDAAPGV